ncbi:GNAT family N-acetyltransferase [Flammeovirga yaeyamensis]|uniref:GNAT family N-acetyltransferase n=1 Tax=Flammeovirga yaeyamensis TaxID=367791 RepID=A0AAX1N7T5_9BACT|nr:GNAT family N-acetyltransferase [Flammeovirga yaeyamensis]MBB3699776.1 GNAT superfamily N-acetyltransferase [Flammeovirga yaeyamensis]NMF36655.1 GNAT family N-acetyltransferase [Flammeovirga yaeyamensis]QWG02300.1 GNAT family N-acetyltransferase [Flammeovirga yaeyamensis]
MEITISNSKDIPEDQIIKLYKANKWSAAEKPEQLHNALRNSHSLISAWEDDQLVGIGNAISDGYLVVYFPHLLVHPDHQGKGIGKKIVDKLLQIYKGFHMQMLTADKEAEAFYQKVGFQKAGETIPMWIYEGNEH